MSGERQALAALPRDVETIRSPIGGDVTFLARGEQTDGAMTVLTVSAPPGEGPPLHFHREQDEHIYVLHGNLRFKLNDDLIEAPTGSSVFLPRGVTHTWQNVGDDACRMLIVFAPAGMEGFFERLAEMTEFEPELFRAAAADNGMEVVGPPLAQSNPL